MASSFQTLVALVSLLLPLSALGAPRDHQLRWIVPPEPLHSGKNLVRNYLALARRSRIVASIVSIWSADSDSKRCPYTSIVTVMEL